MSSASTADAEQQTGTFWMTSEEKEEIDQADLEAEEADRDGTWIPLEEVLAKLGRS